MGPQLPFYRPQIPAAGTGAAMAPQAREMQLGWGGPGLLTIPERPGGGPALPSLQDQQGVSWAGPSPGRSCTGGCRSY